MSVLKKGGNSAPNRRDVMRNSVRIDNDSIRNLEAALGTKKKMAASGIRWSDEVATRSIQKIRQSMIDDLFYNSTDIAEFRYEAFCEECGIDPKDFE